MIPANEPLRIGLTSASFLPAAAWFPARLEQLLAETRRRGFDGLEILATRAALAWAAHERMDAPPGGVASVHEVWNPRNSLVQEIGRVVRLRPQCRGMTPYPMDALFFADGLRSEQAMLTLAERHRAPAVVSCLVSPFSGVRYASPQAALQIHPDLGPEGAHLNLDRVSEAVEALDYPVVMDTYHVRRRVRRHPGGRTEIAPPLPAPGEPSLGGLSAVWSRLGNRVTLIHFQPADVHELRALLEGGRLPETLAALREILRESGPRGVTVILEISPRMVADLRGAAGIWASLPYLLKSTAMWEILGQVRDVLAREAGG